MLYEHFQKTGKLENPKVLQDLLYIRAYQDFRFFATYFFSHHCKDAFSQMHVDFCQLEDLDPARRGRRDVVAAPRGNAKTTFKVLLKVLHAVVYGYEAFILIVGHSAPEAEQKVWDILSELETNERLIGVFGALAPVPGQKSGKARWGKKWFVTQNGIKVMAKSRGQQIRGLKYGAHRPSLIICDDIESPDGVLSVEQRQKTEDWFSKDLLKCGLTGGGSNITVIGTCLHPESLLNTLLQASGWDANKYQAVIRYATRQDLWEQHRALLIDLSNPQRQQAAHAFFKANEAAMLEGAEVLWPEGEPYEWLMCQRIYEGQASFNSEKQNDPHDPERQLFHMEKARKCRVEFEGQIFRRIHWLDGSGKVVEREQLQRIIAFHDPALGKKPNQKSPPDYAAIVVVALDYDGYYYCLDAYIEKDPPSRQIEQGIFMHQRWHFEMLYVEENGAQGLVQELYNNAASGPHPIRVVGVNNHENKQKRISTLEPDIHNGHLLFADNLTPELSKQLTLFPTGKDDGPDALQGAVAQLKKTTLLDLWKALE